MRTLVSRCDEATGRRSYRSTYAPMPYAPITAAALTGMGSRHVDCPAREFVVDQANKIVSILGSKTPHIQNLAVGGVMNAINLDSLAAMNMDRLYMLKDLLDEVIPFVQQVYFPDACAIAEPTYEAVLRASQSRLRPIYMTVAATILGLLPTALDRSEGSNLWSPLAITVVARGAAPSHHCALVAVSVSVVLTAAST